MVMGVKGWITKKVEILNGDDFLSIFGCKGKKRFNGFCWII